MINDQENEDLKLDKQYNESKGEPFNQQEPSHFACKPESDRASTISCYIQPNEISDQFLLESVRSLNDKQCSAYNTVVSWCRNKVKNIHSINPEEINLIYLFITGGGGSGKSHLVKTFRCIVSNPELPTVLLMAATGVSAINIEGTTINTGLAVLKETGENLPAMSDQKNQIRVLLSELKLIIIDEVSMVSNITLLHIHHRLKDKIILNYLWA